MLSNNKVRISTYLSVKRITLTLRINFHFSHHNHHNRSLPYTLITLNLTRQKFTITKHKLKMKIMEVKWIFNFTWQKSKISTKISQLFKSPITKITHRMSYKKVLRRRKNSTKINYKLITNLSLHWLKDRTIIYRQ